MLKRHMERRASLPNAMFVGIGDFFDCIRPGDNRYVEGQTHDVHGKKLPKHYRLSRAYANMVNDFVEFAGKYPWKAIGMGNHEWTAVHRHNIDPSADLAEKLGCEWAGYSGNMRFRFYLDNSSKPRCSHNNHYHHGKWGGDSAIPSGAIKYALYQEGWQTFTFGHHHKSGLQPIARIGWTQRNQQWQQTQYIISTGTSLKGYQHGGDPTYGERAAYPPVALEGPPLIKLKPTSRRGVRYSVEFGEDV